MSIRQRWLTLFNQSVSQSTTNHSSSNAVLRSINASTSHRFHTCCRHQPINRANNQLVHRSLNQHNLIIRKVSACRTVRYLSITQSANQSGIDTASQSTQQAKDQTSKDSQSSEQTNSQSNSQSNDQSNQQSSDQSNSQSTNHSWSRELFWSSVLVIQFCGLMYTLRHTMFDLMTCIGPSMIPTMNPNGDLVLITRFYHSLNQAIKRGDVIVATNPNNPRLLVCKRVIGLPGDKVVIRSTIHEEFDRTITVPTGHIWLQGDNLDNSSDSRSYGPMPRAMIRGKVVAKIWPNPSFLESTMKYSQQPGHPVKRIQWPEQTIEQSVVPSIESIELGLDDVNHQVIAWQQSDDGIEARFRPLTQLSVSNVAAESDLLTEKSE